jgi:proteasome accessory factor C
VSAPGTGARAQVNRLLALVPYLQGKGEISVAAAAEEFGVTPATIRRDVNVLMFCGLPGLGMGDLIEVDFDALEGDDVIRLTNADYLARPLRLDSTEAAALVVGLRSLLETTSESEREVVERTLHKVEDAAGEAARVAHRLQLHASAPTESSDVLAALKRATEERRQVRLTHTSVVRDELTTRVVDPITLSTAAGHTYLDAWCHLAQDQRLFRVDRIAEVELLEDMVSDHADRAPRDLGEGLFRPSPEASTAQVRLTAAATWVPEYYPVEVVEEVGDGTLLVSVRFDDPTWLLRLVLRLGGAATVLEPAELAQQVTATAQRALSNYT